MFYVVVNLYFQSNFSFPLFLCMLMYGNVHKNKGKLKFNWKKKTANLQHLDHGNKHFFFQLSKPLFCAFSDLPEIKTITVQIFKEVDGKKEKRKPVGRRYLFLFILLISNDIEGKILAFCSSDHSCFSIVTSHFNGIFSLSVCLNSPLI